jgi:hypothetical protein
MKTRDGVTEQFHEKSKSLLPENRAQGYHSTAGWMGSTAGLDAEPTGNRTRVLKAVTSHYIQISYRGNYTAN